jgi:lipopolysaccharide/colanic/teichoic acid biosynthesis glycosyltransferase
MYHGFKRFLDVVIALLFLMCSLPVAVLVGIIIFIDSGEPIFFFQERVGKDGIPFKMFKFRSMIKNAEEHTGPVWAKKNDPRITRAGRVIRPFRLDEIPQLVNVLRGEMSIIGPRPERQCFVSELNNHIADYHQRLRIRPGITGLAQIVHKYDTSIADVKKKIELDLYYIDNLSFALDMEILIKTVGVMLKGKGAH